MTGRVQAGGLAMPRRMFISTPLKPEILEGKEGNCLESHQYYFSLPNHRSHSDTVERFGGNDDALENRFAKKFDPALRGVVSCDCAAMALRRQGHPICV